MAILVAPIESERKVISVTREVVQNGMCGLPVSVSTQAASLIEVASLIKWPVLVLE